MEVIDEARSLTSVHPISSSAFLTDLLLAVPLFVREGPEIRFAHKTIGEFFAAEHLAYSQGGADIAQEMCRLEHGDRFFETMRFLSDVSPSLFKRTVARPIAEAFVGNPFVPGGPATRSLVFVAPDSAICLVARYSKEERLEESPNSLIVHALLGSYEEHRLQIRLAGQPNPLLQLCVHLFAEQIDSKQRPIEFGVFADLPLGEWIPIKDARLYSGRKAEMLEAAAPQLTQAFLERTGGAPRGSVTNLTISEDRVRMLLKEVDEEDRATSIVRKLLRS